MSLNTPIQSKIEIVEKQVKDNTPMAIVEAIASQLVIIDEARRRINEEGIVVRDMRGSVISHPAIKIEIEATKTMDALLAKYKTNINRSW